MQPLTRAVLTILVLTSGAGALLNVQGRAMNDALAARQQRLAREAAVAIGADELVRATRAAHAGEAAGGARTVDTPHGGMTLAVTHERHTARAQRLLITVSDVDGEVLATHETIVERDSGAMPADPGRSGRRGRESAAATRENP